MLRSAQMIGFVVLYNLSSVLLRFRVFSRLHARQPPQVAVSTRMHDCHWPLQHSARGTGGGGGGGGGVGAAFAVGGGTATSKAIISLESVENMC